jgi:hypothetical protein
VSTIVDLMPYAVASIGIGIPSAVCKYFALRHVLIDVPPESRVEVLQAFSQVLRAWRWR